MTTHTLDGAIDFYVKAQLEQQRVIYEERLAVKDVEISNLRLYIEKLLGSSK